MKYPALTVVIPTRNREHSLLRLLESMSAQTLPASEFEVVIVDDGSNPPIDIAADAFPFALQVIRRTADHGAHESRFCGLRAARGERVLFLDDDLALQPEVLAGHAETRGVFAIGPILYHPDAAVSAFHRWDARRYAEIAKLFSEKQRILASELYICNSSGPREAFMNAFEGVAALTGGLSLEGEGLDEELLAYELRNVAEPVRFLPKALVLHINANTLHQVRDARYRRARMQARLVLTFPNIRPGFRSLEEFYGGWKVRLFWLMSPLCRAVASLFAMLAASPAANCLPLFICGIPLSVAYCDGLYSVSPRYDRLRQALRDRPVE
jgi:glycosyltransferase involved in cell wall biosynthesis